MFYTKWIIESVQDTAGGVNCIVPLLTGLSFAEFCPNFWVNFGPFIYSLTAETLKK